MVTDINVRRIREFFVIKDYDVYDVVFRQYVSLFKFSVVFLYLLSLRLAPI